MKKEFLKEILNLKNPTQAKLNTRFYKTGKGEYSEHDIFLGLVSAQNRAIAKKYYKSLAPAELEELLHNKYHEIRMTTLFMLVLKYKHADFELKKEIFEIYINNYAYINNWDLVDNSAPYIAGDYVFNYGGLDVLQRLAKSGHLWAERISVVASLYFIKKQSFDYPLKVCEYFLPHNHDLIHKAVGWMLREVGKQDINVLEEFLEKFTLKMSRTTLRYAIERFDEDTRKHYLLMK